ncbi:hypothetical protein DIX60_10655 [Streptococcus iniae]|uniref:hypothetical protein n=1 Tax=Streptococcus iniae TaxID=1346 RepID=UPI000EF68E8C|nr:hypothetical protein [Streptococcus iniae]RLV26744.1 hypothetical protein DIX60_10655 [Streptococcus iniae]
MILLKKNPRCLITDELFLEVEWQDELSPINDGSLSEVVETVDDHLLREDQKTIEDTLPYLSFYQADLLFSALSQAYGYFMFKKVSLCHLDNKGKGASSEGELFASPYVISENYTNLLEPFFVAVTLNKQFSDYSYNEKREYFVVTVFPSYKRSLQLSESAMPVFPSESDLVKIAHEAKDYNRISSAKTPINTKVDSKKNNQNSLKTWLILGFISGLAIMSLFLNFSLMGRINEVKKNATYLYGEIQMLKENQKIEHQIDVFSRYFIPVYFSGDKQRLLNFLDDGDAKYTDPKKEVVQSVILENVSKNQTKTFNVVYVLSLKNPDDTFRQIKISFNVKKSKVKPYGFVLISEPEITDYFKDFNNK